MEDQLDIFDKIMMLPLLRKLNAPYKKYKEALLYIFFGGLATVVSISTFILFYDLAGLDALVANAFSWVITVSFAFATNRTWVFRSQAKGKAILGEMASFFGGRVLTLVFEEVVLLVFITWLHFDSLLVKVAAQVGVLVFNYLISKFITFRKK